MKRLVFLGPPASGKGTQAQRVSALAAIPHVSTGQMLRAAAREGVDLGVDLRGVVERGQYAPDHVVVELVRLRLTQPDAAEGFILDGFPRTMPQASALDSLLSVLGRPLEAAVFLDVPTDLIVERATLRRTDKRTGLIYHLKYNPPPLGAVLEQRADDREETVLERIEEYEALTAALLPFYEERGTLRRVDGTGTVEQVAGRLDAALQLTSRGD